MNSNSTRGPQVEVMEVPHEGIQPVARFGSQGVLHMIYFKGDPVAGDLYYVRRPQGQEMFSEPVRVNSHPGSVIAAGTVRGAHLAIGESGRLHVAWMGSSDARPKGPEGATPMLYTRSTQDGSAFEDQRNVMQFAEGLDGGGTVAADGEGNVFVLWHAGAGKEGEQNRRVWMARSKDGGDTFGREVAISPPAAGACGCCGISTTAAEGGSVYTLFRGAETVDQRDVYLLGSDNALGEMNARKLAEWPIDRCPMSTFDIHAADGSVAVSWENREQVAFTVLESGRLQGSPVIHVPGEGNNRKHPAVAVNDAGEVLLAWTEGTGWQQGGSLHWQVFDQTGEPISDAHMIADGIPVWSRPDAFVDDTGHFTVVH